MAREIIDDRENAYFFNNVLIDHEDFVSDKCHGSFCNDFEQS